MPKKALPKKLYAAWVSTGGLRYHKPVTVIRNPDESDRWWAENGNDDVRSIGFDAPIDNMKFYTFASESEREVKLFILGVEVMTECLPKNPRSASLGAGDFRDW